MLVGKEFGTPVTCRGKIRGYVNSSWSDRLGDMTITTTRHADGSVVTTLYGQLRDEAALAGVLSALHDLGFPRCRQRQKPGLRIEDRSMCSSTVPLVLRTE